jgi:hypothetical protein
LLRLKLVAAAKKIQHVITIIESFYRRREADIPAWFVYFAKKILVTGTNAECVPVYVMNFVSYFADADVNAKRMFITVVKNTCFKKARARAAGINPTGAAAVSERRATDSDERERIVMLLADIDAKTVV